MIRAAALVLVTTLVVIAAYVVPHPQNGAKAPLHCGRVTAAWYVPPPSMFGQYNVSSIVHSDYSNEASLIGGTYPNDDEDLMHPGLSETVILPGDRRDTYYYLGAQDIPGSGWAEEFAIGGNGGRFAFLHMLSLPGATPPQAAAPDPGTPRTCQDPTASAIVAMRAPGIALMHGGQAVGRSGWPTWTMYGNGSAGPQDAHLCIVTGPLATAWFYHIATRGPIPRPKRKPFPTTTWLGWRTAHHQPAITHKDRYGHLTLTATIWLKHQSLRGIRYAPKYHRAGYRKAGFRCGAVYTWKRTGKVVRGRCASL